MRTDGSVIGWGYNRYGQVSVPPGLSNVVAISAGYYHTLALKNDGSVWTWGLNGHGQLGTNTTTDSHRPIQVVGVGGTGTLGSVARIVSTAIARLSTRFA